MSRTISLVQRVQIASPCTASWEEMTGDDRVRFCSHCQLNVYNLSAMSQQESEQLIREKEGKLCARIYRRRDGTILTKDCPVGLRAVRRRAIAFGVKVAAAVLVIMGTMLTFIVGQRRQRAVYEDLVYSVEVNISAFDRTTHVMKRWLSTNSGSQPMIMGEIAIPQSFNPPDDETSEDDATP